MEEKCEYRIRYEKHHLEGLSHMQEAYPNCIICNGARNCPGYATSSELEELEKAKRNRQNLEKLSGEI